MKKIPLIITMILVIVFMMCACGANNNPPEVIKSNGRSIRSYDILQEEFLIYDTNTKIVYIKQYLGNAHYAYTLYLSENGLPYRYENGELIEVEQLN